MVEMLSGYMEETGIEWKPVIEELRPIVNDSEYAIVVSFIAQRDLIEGVLNFSKVFGQRMILIAENAEDFLDPYDPPYEVILKQKISSVDPGRNLHAKIFLFGKQLSSQSHILRCLIGSPNATINGCCKNIEFWATSEAVIDLSESSEDSLLALFKNEKIDPRLLPLTNLIEETDLVIAPLVDLIWRLIRDSRGLAAGLDPGRSECVSDRLVESNASKQAEAIFVHTLGNNSLWKAIKNTIQSTVKSAEKDSSLEIVSPYHNWKGIYNILKICRESLRKYNQRIRVKLLTTFPPHFPNMYLQAEAFDDLEKIKPGDKRVEFEYRLWTKSSEIEVPKLARDESLQNLSRVFLHGKLLIASNDKDHCQALLGSQNLTAAAIAPSPKVNLECGVWERNQSKAKAVRESFKTLWESAQTLNPKLKKQFEEWQKTLSEDIESLSLWNEREDVLRSCIQQELLANGKSLGSQRLFLDEVPKASIDIRIQEQCPSLDLDKIRCICLPDLDIKHRCEIRAKRIADGHLRFGLNIPEIEPCRLFYKVVVPTKFVRESKARFKKSDGNGILVVAPTFRKDLHDNRVLVKTSEGFREHEVSIDKNEELVCKGIPSVVLGKTAKIRLYSKDTQTNTSLGWKAITISKRRPEIRVHKSCSCGSALCMDLEEIAKPKTSRLLPHSVTIGFGEDEAPTPSVHIENRISDVPYHVHHFFLFSDGKQLPVQEGVPFEAHFLDDCSYLRKKEDRSIHLFAKPRLMKKTCHLYETITEILDSADKIEMNTFPKPGAIVDKAPILISLKFPRDIVGLVSEGTRCLFLEWHLLHWGRTWHGDPIAESVNSETVTVKIRPNQLVKALETDLDSLLFEGTFEGRFFIKLRAGWRIPICMIRFEIMPAEEYLERIFTDMQLSEIIDKYVEDESKTSKKIMDIMYEYISKCTLYRPLRFREFLRWFKWGFSGFPGTFGDSNTEHQGFLLPEKDGWSLLDEIQEEIVKEVTPSFLSDPNQPKIDERFLSKELRERLKVPFGRASRSDSRGLIIFPNLIFGELGLSSG